MELRDRWDRLLPDAKPLGADLLGRYAEPHRAYHDQRHLTEVLDTIDELAGEAKDPDDVRLAAWFHDAVYDPKAKAGANEEESAQLAEAELAAYGLEAARVAEVGRLIRLTAGHDSTEGDANGAVLCDSDLRILATDKNRYERYTADVRKEYAHVPDADFAKGRARILEQLGTGRIFRTTHAYDAWEPSARENVGRELDRLRPGAAARRWAGLVPLLYLGAALGLVLGAAVFIGRAYAAAPVWPAVPGAGNPFPWWAPVAGVAVAALTVTAWLMRARPRVMLALCAPLALAGAGGVVLAKLRWPDAVPGAAMSERWPYLLLASVAVLLGGVLLAVGCRLRTIVSYAARPPRLSGPVAVTVVTLAATLVALAAGPPFVQARLEAANTTSAIAPEPPAADAPVRLDGELAWTAEQPEGGTVAGTAGGLAQLLPDGVVTLDAATGKARWSYRRADVTGATAPSAHGLVVSSDRQTLAVNLPAGPHTGGIDLPTYAVLDAVSGAVLSEVHTLGTALAVDRDRLVVADGNSLEAYPAGNADHWRIRTDCPAQRAELVAGTVVAVVSCAPSGSETLRGLDATDGALRWSLDDGSKPQSGTTGTTETGGLPDATGDGYRIGDLAAIPDSRQLAGLGWSPDSGGSLYQWVVDTGDGSLVWSTPLPGSPRPQPGAGGCAPGLMADHATVVLIACRPKASSTDQMYDLAAANPADGTPLWHHLLAVPTALQNLDYPQRGFALMTDGRVITLMPGASGCQPVLIGTTGVVPRPLAPGSAAPAAPAATCNGPQAALAGNGRRPVLTDATHVLALR